MKTVFIEATGSGGNWGKFMVGVFDKDELAKPSAIDGRPLVWGRGWAQGHVLVVDLATGEGGMFKMGGLASADLEKHAIWVCPLFEHFLAWLYIQPDPMCLPPSIELEAPLAFAGYRRTGPQRAMAELAQDLLTGYQTFAAAADGAVSTELEARADAMGLDTKAWNR